VPDAVQVLHLRVPPLDASLRVRIAPAPSGELHVGNVRAALFNWALARRHGGTFILRLEDTDASRVTDAYVEAAQRDLAWLGLDWDEGPAVGGPFAPYRQSERAAAGVYAAAVDRLLAAGSAYRAFDTPAELAAGRDAAAAARTAYRYDGSRWRAVDPAESAALAAAGEPFVVRFAMPPGSTTWLDLVRGEVTIAHAEIPDFTLTRSDGAPLYLLAASVDDAAMGLTHVVRGEDLISAVPRQLAIYAALGHPESAWPAFAHLPLIDGPDGRPLSKRNGETSLAAYRDAGFLPEAVRNYLGQLGFSLPSGAEFFDVDEFVVAFGLDRVQRNHAQFDVKKLEALNGEWIRSLAPAELATRVRPWLVAGGLDVDDELLLRAVPALQSRLRRLADAVELLRPLFAGSAFGMHPDDAATVLVGDVDAQLEVALSVLAVDGLAWEPGPILAALQAALVDGMGLKRKTALGPLYVAVGGRRAGYPLTDLMVLLGREATLQRVGDALARLRGDAG